MFDLKGYLKNIVRAIDVVKIDRAVLTVLTMLFVASSIALLIVNHPRRANSDFANRIATAATPSTNSVVAPYTARSHFDNVPFGSHSHWLQPWRAYLETVPAAKLLQGVGIQLDLHDRENPDLVLQMLATHGIQTARLEIGWNNLSYDRQTLQNDRLQAILTACKRWKVRPLILLNANQGIPTPTQFFERTIAVTAPAGSRQIQLNDTSGLTIGNSGFNNLTDDGWAAEALITAIDGKTVSLSKPLPKAIAAGSSVKMATLRYRPFAKPGSADYRQTIAGWQHYVGTVANFGAKALGTTQSNDKGFDMEIWNELTFGSKFLSINNYYRPVLAAFDEDSIWQNLVTATADYAVAHPQQFAGVKFSDGFANTIPWPAASTQPVRISAISKHPYANRKNFPQDEQHGQKLDAFGKPTNFIPTYSALFPEYYATALQTETLLRDAAPFTNDIQGVRHGRYARQVKGRVVPTDVWITETGIAPQEHGIADRSQALALKAKTTARYYTFYPNKGVTKLYLYSAASGDLGLGIMQDNFLEYASSHSVYPKDDRPYVSPALQITSQIVRQMKQNLDPALTQARQLQLDSIRDPHNQIQFGGDGTAAHPQLYNRDVFAFLPYQVNSHRFVVPYYVMTRDVTKNLPPAKFAIQISKLKAQGATVSVYDPLHDRTLPVSIDRRGRDFLSLTLSATDYPYLLIIQER
ncbi:hypothetical protein [Chamaesiphon sp. GL140_3_metabinner_50]|uniref:hypothetical protein n=1 Tax=Chamaesiphon sp. GL140_3_metabinner_50 TaxID=2970812 RepID=UPI0025D7AA3C|nr:hypothetical protein [Chamaesiphon sp. GL140_3_metabinner_50]